MSVTQGIYLEAGAHSSAAGAEIGGMEDRGGILLALESAVSLSHTPQALQTRQRT
jgi:hypothetical protein